MQWSGSNWKPSTPPDSEFSYEVSVFDSDNSRISSFTSEKPTLSLLNVAGYLGQNLKFAVQAVGMMSIGEHDYDFQSEIGEFSWIVPAATPTPTNTPTKYAYFYAYEYANEYTPTDTPTNTPTRLPKDSPQTLV